MCMLLVIRDTGENVIIYVHILIRTALKLFSKLTLLFPRAELQKKLPWLAIKEPLPDTASAVTESTTAPATAAAPVSS